MNVGEAEHVTNTILFFEFVINFVLHHEGEHFDHKDLFKYSRLWHEYIFIVSFMNKRK